MPAPDPPPPQHLHTADRTYPLHEFHLAISRRDWKIFHTGVVLTHADELKFLREERGHLPYGVALWPSAIALAHELAGRGEALAGKTVLELGAGTGLPGIVAASLGAKLVQTDRDAGAMILCKRNGQQNGVAAIEHRLVDWTDWHDDSHYDWIIGSDILYGEPMHPYLQQIFQSNLAPGGRVLLSDPFRTMSLRLFESLQEQGWNVAVTRWNLGDQDNPRAVGLFELQR